MVKFIQIKSLPVIAVVSADCFKIAQDFANEFYYYCVVTSINYYVELQIDGKLFYQLKVSSKFADEFADLLENEELLSFFLVYVTVLCLLIYRSDLVNDQFLI